MKPPTLDDLVGGDSAVARAVDLCRKVSDADLPLLILGETGVGKDTLARALHAASRRSRKPFVAINCAAIPASLLASELFGYVPGTFTGGAKSGYAGKFIASNGGTFFLDEIGDMPLDLQAYLLRVLDQRVVTPLGSNKPVPIDVRFMSATHRDLQNLVKQDRFRQDLFYRIRGLQVRLPALRNRSDLPVLASRLFHEEAARLAYVATPSDEVMNTLLKYDWPGHLRELRNVIRLALCTCDGGNVKIAHLPSPLRELALGLELPVT